MATKKPTEGAEPQEPEQPPQEPQEPVDGPWVVMAHPEAWTGQIAVGAIVYDVAAGHVRVRLEHVAAVAQAGFVATSEA